MFVSTTGCLETIKIMANIYAIHSVGNSLITYLRHAYQTTSLHEEHPCTFRLLSSGEMAEMEDPGTTLSLYLYRLAINEHTRNMMQRRDNDEIYSLTLDLYYLLTTWARSALAEQTILAWAMRQLFLHPILNISSLSPEANWQSNDVVQVIPAEISNEDIMRIWDAFEPSYRLSFSYVARVARIDPDEIPGGRPVVVTRFDYEQTQERRP
jgi:hypothetical protein